MQHKVHWWCCSWRPKIERNFAVQIRSGFQVFSRCDLLARKLVFCFGLRHSNDALPFLDLLSFETGLMTLRCPMDKSKKCCVVRVVLENWPGTRLLFMGPAQSSDSLPTSSLTSPRHPALNTSIRVFPSAHCWGLCQHQAYGSHQREQRYFNICIINSMKLVQTLCVRKVLPSFATSGYSTIRNVK